MDRLALWASAAALFVVLVALGFFAGCVYPKPEPKLECVTRIPDVGAVVEHHCVTCSVGEQSELICIGVPKARVKAKR